MLGDLRRWLVNWADSPWGPGALAILAAAESVFFPLPPDPLLIALAVRNPDAALLLAGLTIAASVLGGLAGHWLGGGSVAPCCSDCTAAGSTASSPCFAATASGRWRSPASPPSPTRVFTIGAGVFDVPRIQFVLASIVGRGIRFGSYGVLIFFLGDRVEEFLDECFDLIVPRSSRACC